MTHPLTDIDIYGVELEWCPHCKKSPTYHTSEYRQSIRCDNQECDFTRVEELEADFKIELMALKWNRTIAVYKALLSLKKDKE